MAGELPISGMTGSVTFAAGYVTLANGWTIRQGATLQRNTGFNPTSGWETTSTEVLKRWSGSYKCRVPIADATNVTGPAYCLYPRSFNLILEAPEMEATKFTDTWRRMVLANLPKKASGQIEVLIDDTSTLPLAGTAPTIVITADAGRTYTIPAILGDELDAGAAADGSTRRVVLPFQNTGVVVVAGGLPEPAVTGAATFVAYTGRQYAGTILVTRVELRMNAERTEGEFTIGFVGSGACTPG